MRLSLELDRHHHGPAAVTTFDDPLRREARQRLTDGHPRDPELVRQFDLAGQQRAWSVFLILDPAVQLRRDAPVTRLARALWRRSGSDRRRQAHVGWAINSMPNGSWTSLVHRNSRSSIPSSCNDRRIVA